MFYFWIGIAGMVGALLRYGMNLFVQGWAGDWFPWGTLAENWLGCFVLGWFQVWAGERLALSPQWRTALGTGLIGSFTTFSTFSVDTMELMMQGAMGAALLYVLASLWGGILLAWAGWRLGHRSLQQKGTGI
ncbi:fluoride efflux transporter CrcB [Desmospora profundinema]|uniref:Fluoride-specific ion channel FluC n=1 Tax=Desmospora profundinema TaxID=1571184 RepID=A0ABU1IIX8_9BACL|nr:fluoride efflux transporter CrcB [Desmospora profundinema]MDR6224732.1 CrcB protein [Desmospora profundinema]